MLNKIKEKIIQEIVESINNINLSKEEKEHLELQKRKKEEYNINAWNNLVDSFALNFVTGKKYNEKIKKYKEKYESSKQTKRQ